MYSPSHFKENREDIIHEVMRDFSFATIISTSNHEPIISHLPVMLDIERKILVSHCARANPHWKLFKEDSPVTVIFNGPHAYISPALYAPSEDNVPTWNYIAIHVTGAVRIIEDVSLSWNLMSQLVKHYENYYQTGWSLPLEPNERLKKDIQKGIVVFEISLDKIDAKFKLSQNRESEDINSVIEKLPSYSGEQGLILTKHMRRLLKN